MISVIDFLTKDWRHMAATGLVCFVGFAFVGAHMVGNPNRAKEQKAVAAERAINERFDEIAAELGAKTTDAKPAADDYIDGKKVYNPKTLTVVVPNAACEHWGNIGKYLSLKVASEDEIAAKLGCLSLPKGWKSVYVDKIGEQYTQILVNIGGHKLLLWMRSSFLKNDVQIAVDKECDLGDRKCHERVARGFVTRY